MSIKWKSKVQENWTILQNNQNLALILLCVLVVSSILVYKFIEEPLIKRINRSLRAQIQ
jgi:peptidoglycan/LPS O-acetylase OafA/YrhL